MTKRGIHIDIPGFGSLHVKAMCSDYTGTLSYRGKLIGGVRERLCELSKRIDIHIVTSDTRKTARAQLEGLPVHLNDDIPVTKHDDFKRRYVKKLGLRLNQVVVFGNGRNDRWWLKAVRDAGELAIAVDVGEGCALEAMTTAHVFVSGITNALDLLLDEKRIVGTLRTEGDTLIRGGKA
jgi:soluble P-type ATPase